MNATDAAALLARAAAFDNRKPSAAAAQAWAAALRDIPLDDDTLEAVARFYGGDVAGESGERWIQPHHVRALRKAIRADRIGPAGPGLHPAPPPADPDDPDAYLRALRAQQRAIGDGRTSREALPAGDPPDPHDNPAARDLLAEYRARQEAKAARDAAARRAESAALREYRDAVEVLLSLPDHGRRALEAARDHLLGDAQAAHNFPDLRATPGVHDEHRFTIWAARTVATESEPT